jgi:hypothetical protein
MTSLEQYLQRAAILGADPRGGAMVMLFATELMGGKEGAGPLPAGGLLHERLVRQASIR